MPDGIQASAPGKLVLTGEYAVLDGAPALSMAVDRRATVHLAPARRYRVSAPGLLAAPVEFAPDGNGGLQWPGVAPATRRRLALFTAIAAPLLHEHPHEPFAAQLDTRAFFLNDIKLGFGSSAALATSLTGALSRFLGLPPQRPADLLSTLLKRHRSVQQGHGSGIDLATCLHGGVIEYTLQADAPSVRTVKLPNDLHWLCVWTGAAAVTGDFLAGVARWRTAEPTAAGAVLASLADKARAAAAALSDTSLFLQAVEAYGAGLDQLGRAAGVDVVSTTHREIATIAATHGTAYKPSGAGGGDLGLAFSNNKAQLQRLATALAAADFHCPAITLSSEGLVVHE